MQPPIPTSIPSTADSAYAPDSPIVAGPEGPLDRSPPPRLRRPGVVALVALVALLTLVALWRLGSDGSRPAPEPAEPAPRVGTLTGAPGAAHG
jgi:hypothetical protein